MARTGISWHHMDWPEGVDQGSNTINYRFWMPGPCRLLAVQALIAVVNTQGAHTITVAEGSGGLTVLVGAAFDLTTLVADTPTNLALTATETRLELTAGEILTLSVVSDNASYDGSGLFFGLLVQEH